MALIVGVLVLHGLIRAMGFAKAFGLLAIGSRHTPTGEARWLLPEGEFVYGEFNVEGVAINLPPR